ncbi:acyl transferase/acyl hydrolase/lysophospholipase [Catenaria anguillulae PL171]|uniref:Acyl transferase/acyl hydrolase/lysophospholipase n=1 Tax=Catenaria anguillulae PL171 TaxID=765915 RepID=A0A1Y2HAH3_9FUNG|nr:acyl transferase/acyl hydrolase/lysophospholipase [Catenaria anguillulae PL171]
MNPPAPSRASSSQSPPNERTTSSSNKDVNNDDDQPPSASSSPPNGGGISASPSTSSLHSLHVLTSSSKTVATDVASHHLTRLRSAIARLLVAGHSRSYYQHLMSAATSYEQWSAAAAMLDIHDGNEQWKRDPQSPLYDWSLIQDRLTAMREARDAGDLPRLILLLRTSLSRNLGNMGNPMLYGACHIGTKHLIEEYMREAVRCLNLICDATELPNATRMEFFLNVRQAFGRTALLLSGGATLALNHIGVVKALWETRLLPRIISGASGGSIIASLVCTHTEEDFERLLNPAYTRLDFFDDPSENGILHIINRVFKHGVLFDVDTLIKTVQDMFGDITFLEAYNRTRRILNITVSSSTVYEMPRLLNYITAPNVYIWSAVAASCSVPYVFKPAPLLAKDRSGKPVQWNPSGHRWIDGSVESDLPMQKLAELFNVNHFVVSQVNPHVVPFIPKGLSKGMFRSACESVLNFSRNEFNLRCNQLRELGLLPEVLYRAQSIVSQKYMGDITIIPEVQVSDFVNILTNPTPKSMLESTLKGERATWPKISIMQNHLHIEMALDEMLYRCRLRALQLQHLPTQLPTTIPQGPATAFPSLNTASPIPAPILLDHKQSMFGLPPSSATPSGSPDPPQITLNPGMPRTLSADNGRALVTPSPSPLATAASLRRGLVPHGWGMRATANVSPGASSSASSTATRWVPKPRVKSATQLSGYWQAPTLLGVSTPGYGSGSPAGSPVPPPSSATHASPVGRPRRSRGSSPVLRQVDSHREPTSPTHTRRKLTNGHGHARRRSSASSTTSTSSASSSSSPPATPEFAASPQSDMGNLSPPRSAPGSGTRLVNLATGVASGRAVSLDVLSSSLSAAPMGRGGYNRQHPRRGSVPSRSPSRSPVRVRDGRVSKPSSAGSAVPKLVVHGPHDGRGSRSSTSASIEIGGNGHGIDSLSAYLTTDEMESDVDAGNRVRGGADDLMTSDSEFDAELPNGDYAGGGESSISRSTIPDMFSSSSANVPVSQPYGNDHEMDDDDDDDDVLEILPRTKSQSKILAKAAAPPPASLPVAQNSLIAITNVIDGPRPDEADTHHAAKWRPLMAPATPVQPEDEEDADPPSSPMRFANVIFE